MQPYWLSRKQVALGCYTQIFFVAVCFEAKLYTTLSFRQSSVFVAMYLRYLSFSVCSPFRSLSWISYALHTLRMLQRGRGRRQPALVKRCSANPGHARQSHTYAMCASVQIDTRSRIARSCSPYHFRKVATWMSEDRGSLTHDGSLGFSERNVSKPPTSVVQVLVCRLPCRVHAARLIANRYAASRGLGILLWKAQVT